MMSPKIKGLIMAIFSFVVISIIWGFIGHYSLTFLGRIWAIFPLSFVSGIVLGYVTIKVCDWQNIGSVKKWFVVGLGLSILWLVVGFSLSTICQWNLHGSSSGDTLLCNYVTGLTFFVPVAFLSLGISLSFGILFREFFELLNQELLFLISITLFISIFSGIFALVGAVINKIRNISLKWKDFSYVKKWLIFGIIVSIIVMAIAVFSGSTCRWDTIDGSSVRSGSVFICNYFIYWIFFVPVASFIVFWEFILPSTLDSISLGLGIIFYFLISLSLFYLIGWIINKRREQNLDFNNSEINT